MGALITVLANVPDSSDNLENMHKKLQGTHPWFWLQYKEICNEVQLQK